MSIESFTRRDFLKAGATAGLAAGLTLQATVGRAESPGDKKLRIGFIGTGGRGRSLLKDVLGHDNVEVAVICDITPENLKKGLDLVEEKTSKRPEGFGEGNYDYRKVLARKDLDCVVLATPCYWHTTMYLDALAAGMDFYGEKPMAITAWELAQIQEARKKHPDVVMQIGTQWGAHQGRGDIIKKVREGLIGDLLQGRFHRFNSWDTFSGWFTERDKSGDWMLEQAVHELNLMYWVTQTHPKSVFATGRSGIIPGRDTTSFYTALIEYPEPFENLVIRYTHSFIEVPEFDDKKGGWDFRIIGTKGGVDLMDAKATLREAPEGAEKIVAGEGPEGDTFEHFTNFFDCVRAGTPDKVNCGLEAGVGHTIIGLMIRQSIEQKRLVTLEETLADPRRPPVPAA